MVFAGTVALSIAVIGQQARYYFTDLLGDAGRVEPIGTSFNQSWRGGVSRTWVTMPATGRWCWPESA